MGAQEPEVPFLEASRPSGATVRLDSVATNKALRQARKDEETTKVDHHEWRRRLYVPSVDGDDNIIGDYRITRGVYKDGEEFILSDYWRSAKRPNRKMNKEWRGSTEFTSSRTSQESEAPNSAARWLTPRSPGNSSSERESGPIRVVGKGGGRSG